MVKIRVDVGPQWITTGDTFIHLGDVQRSRAYLCPCSQRFGGVCEGCGRLLADVLEGGDLGVTGVRCDQCGRVYPLREAPRVCEDEAASAYDRAFARVSTHFLPFL